MTFQATWLERDPHRSDLPVYRGRSGPGLALDLDRRAGELFPPILTGMALLMAILALSQATLPGQPHAPTLLVGKVGASLVFLLSRFALIRWEFSPGWTHVAATAAGVLTLVVLLHHLQVLGEPRETTYLLLLILGTGLLFLDAAWFAAMATLILGGWVVVAGPRLAEPEWVYFGGALLGSTALASVILHVRIRGAHRMASFRREERIRQLELETALQQTERARQGEEEARKALEDALVQVKESEERFRRLADASFEGIVIFRGGRIVDANARAAELFSVAVPQLIGDPVLNLVARPGRERARAYLTSAPAQNHHDSVELEGRRSDGSRFPMELTVVQSLMQGQEAQVLIIRDVTNQKRVEGVLRRALEEAEANSRAKSTFLANMSHELRTPLNSVIGFANILNKRLDGKVLDREQDYLRRILANGEHLLSLIEDILDLAKIDARRMELQPTPVQLDELVSEVVDTLEFQARKKGLDLTTQVPDGMEPIEADRRRLKQILLNLLGNAVKFTEQGGVRLHVESSQDGTPKKIHVADTGIGIPPDRLERIFEPFEQVDASHTRVHGGTGLGLAISRSFCELMGFDLTVESRLGRGATFTLDLAPEPEAALHPQAPRSHST